jgi:serine/threonine protein kinase
MSSGPDAKGPRRNIRIGKYVVLSHIATGGMGAVYKARDTEGGEEVALKVLPPEMAAKPSMVERFRREAKHAAKLRHENIVTLHEFGEANGTFYIVMEFVDGTDLHEYISRHGRLDPNEALDIVTQACRALDHAYQQGVVHRDVKPSNFLLTEKNGRRVVKLVDLGLARDANEEDFRVTRAGTTVGSLDYIAPEQARDSGLADIRSDLYSLGGTWYHLLSGHAPFPKGGLGERLHRILNEIPLDIRLCNPDVSDSMAGVVHRLLAKRPSQRYQTPAELLRDLEALKRGESLLTPRQALEHLAQQEDTPVQPGKKPRAPSDGRRTPHSVSKRRRADGKSSKSTMEVPIPREEKKKSPYLWYSLGGVAALILVVASIVALSLRRERRDDTSSDQTARIETPHQPTVNPPVVVPPATTPKTEAPVLKTVENPPVAAPPRKPVWPPLYRRTEKIDAAALRKEIEAPWRQAATPGPTVQLIVGRLPADPAGKTFPSLASACKAIPTGATGIIELHDNGPFFDVPTSLVDRSLVLRAAKGYHPLLIWDVPRMLDEQRRARRTPEEAAAPPVFVDVKHGNLTLQNIQVAFQWPDAPSQGAALLRVQDGDLHVEGCTFSVAGKPRDGAAIAQFVSTKESPAASEMKKDLPGRKCLFRCCHARGAKMTVLDVQTPGAAVLLDNCLFVGDELPLLRVGAAHDRPVRLHAARSTMICGKNLLDLRPSTPGDRAPAFEWLGWDLLLTRKNPEVGGELARLSDGIEPSRMKWRAVNCLYAGWSNLITGSITIAATDLSAWHRLWNESEGEAVQGDRWPTAVSPELAEVSAQAYRSADTPVAFASSASEEELLGCDLARLPPSRDSWLSLTYERYPLVVPEVPEDDSPPQILPSTDGMYHGERLLMDGKSDLGAYLTKIGSSVRFAPEIVLHLSGSGPVFSSPIRLKGSSLVLYFEPPEDKKEPLVLVPTGRVAAEALFDIEEGNLSILNGNLRFTNAAEVRVVPWLVRVRGGDLRLFRTHLLVPPRESGAAFRGLISFDGSAERVRSILIDQSVLVSAVDAISVEGIGARVLLKQTLCLTGGNVLRLKLDPEYSRLAKGPPFTAKANVQCFLDRVTIAAAGAVMHLPDVTAAGPPAEPVVLQTHDCGFVNLFANTARPALIRYEGEALAHGLLLWQSENDAFDRRLWFAAVGTTAPLPKIAQSRASWITLWGSAAMRQAKDVTVNAVHHLDGDRWSLERLSGWKAPGANLEKLRLPEKSSIKLPR